jgi:hypothetical protein
MSGPGALHSIHAPLGHGDAGRTIVNAAANVDW